MRVLAVQRLSRSGAVEALRVAGSTADFPFDEEAAHALFRDPTDERGGKERPCLVRADNPQTASRQRAGLEVLFFLERGDLGDRVSVMGVGASWTKTVKQMGLASA